MALHASYFSITNDEFKKIWALWPEAHEKKWMTTSLGKLLLAIQARLSGSDNELYLSSRWAELDFLINGTHLGLSSEILRSAILGRAFPNENGELPNLPKYPSVTQVGANPFTFLRNQDLKLILPLLGAIDPTAWPGLKNLDEKKLSKITVGSSLETNQAQIQYSNDLKSLVSFFSKTLKMNQHILIDIS